MISLIDELGAVLADAFEAEGLDRALGRVQRSDRPDLADFQCNGAMAAAKAARQAPRDIAARIVARLEGHPALAEVSIAGPGFINLRASAEALAARIDALAGEARLGVPAADPALKVVIDFGGPNVAKPMHVGHLRSAIIGDCLQRLMRFLGHEVVSDVHLGDWGLQMGMILCEIRRRDPALPFFDAGHRGSYPEDLPISLEEFGELYPAAAAAAKADPAVNAEAQEMTARLQAGDPGLTALWRLMVGISVESAKEGFGALGVEFDLWLGESDADPLIPEMVRLLEEKNLLEESEGARIIRVDRDDDKTELPPVIVQSSKGTALYHTTDLATILDRARRDRPDLILYVVDQRQNVHFRQVFRAAEMAGFADGIALEHIGFGTVNGPDGKPFKTREGGVMTLEALIAAAVEAAEIRLVEADIGQDYPKAERAAIARAVGLAAMKFADLSNYRTSDYIFDIDRFTAFEGKTGPYLQYAAVRIKSILRRAGAEGLAPGPVRMASDQDRELALHLAGFADALAQTAEKRAPNMLCDYVFTLAQSFSRFYTAHHILTEGDAGLRASRLALASLTLAVLEQGLTILGIEVPERM